MEVDRNQNALAEAQTTVTALRERITTLSLKLSSETTLRLKAESDLLMLHRDVAAKARAGKAAESSSQLPPLSAECIPSGDTPAASQYEPSRRPLPPPGYLPPLPLSQAERPYVAPY